MLKAAGFFLGVGFSYDLLYGQTHSFSIYFITPAVLAVFRGHNTYLFHKILPHI
jgi:hypothetical protein